MRWRQIRWTLPLVIVLAATMLSAAAMGTYAVWRQSHFQTHAHDLGIFDQAIWELSRGHVPAVTIRQTPVPNIFGDHFHPVIAVLVPFYWLWSSPDVLLIAQALLLSLVIPLSYIFARQLRISPWPAAIMAVAFGLNPGIGLAVHFDFHELAFSVPLFLLTMIFAERRQWKWYWISLLAFMLTKESMTVYAALIGVMLVCRKQWIRGGATIVIGIAAFFLITRVIMPPLSGGLGYGYWQQYTSLAATPAQLPMTLLQHPLSFLRAFFDQPEKIHTMKIMFGSFAFLPLASLATLPLVAFSLAERFWSTNVGLWPLQFQYQLMMVAIYAIATLYAVRTIKNILPWKTFLEYGAAIVLATTSIAAFVIVKPYAPYANMPVHQLPLSDWNAVVKQIPPTATVSAQDAFVPHLAHRFTMYQFPRVRDADYIVLDPRAPSWPLSASDIATWETQLQNNSDWKRISVHGTAMVFQRIGHTTTLPTVVGWE